RVKQAIFGSEVAAQDDTLLMALEFTGIEPLAVAQRMSGRLLKGRSDAVLITRTMKLLYKDRPDIEVWFIVSGDRDLNALCKAIKDEDKHVYLIAGDRSLANELRDSPYLRDDVFLLEDLIPQARWTRQALRADDTQVDKPPALAEPPRRAVRRGGVRARARTEPHVPAVVPTASPESEKEQRRLAVLLLDQLVALHARSMARVDFVTSVVPLSEKEASSVLEQRIDAGIEQGTVLAKHEGRARSKAKQMLAPNMSSPLVAETIFHLVRVLRRIDTVTSKDTRRIPAVEAVLDPLSRADQPGGLARGRSQRRILLETLFNIAEERGAIATEQVEREGRQITMCWLAEGHPLVVYARQPAASIVHLFNFVGSTRAKGDRIDWVNQALFAELLSRVEGDGLESTIKRAVERGVMRPEEHGKKSGYVIDHDHDEVRTVLGEFDRLNGEVRPPLALPPPTDTLTLPGTAVASAGGTGDAATPAPRKRTRRGRRGGRGRRGHKKAATGEAAD
ncbi:MAG TPA: NYN domain-containing protein, partial [Candidatus Limnocylindria bacterium]|nr:NYN domain-containing protein [Candidatus Limnocylindria bacterium]